MNQPQVLNDLALLAIGIGFGAAICLIAVLVYALYHTATSFSRTVNASLKLSADQLAANKLAIQQMQNNVNFALSRLDAEALRASSLAIQRSAKTLASQVDQLQKVVFAQPPSPALDFTAGGLADEAEDDARLIGEQANRWNGGVSAGYSAPSPPPDADPLANLSPEERRHRTMEYFEKRRARAAGFPYLSDQPPQSFASAPPTAGSGIYASLLEEAASRPPIPPAPAPDFSGLETDSEIDLAGKGELE